MGVKVGKDGLYATVLQLSTVQLYQIAESTKSLHHLFALHTMWSRVLTFEIINSENIKTFNYQQG